MVHLKKTTSLLILSIATICGCSTTSGLLEEQPELYSSAKSIEALELCLTDTWTKNNKDVRVYPMKDGKRVILNNPASQGTMAIVELRKGDSGSKISYWKGAGFTGWSRDDLKSCL